MYQSWYVHLRSALNLPFTDWPCSCVIIFSWRLMALLLSSFSLIGVIVTSSRPSALPLTNTQDHTSRSCLPFKSDCSSLWSGDVHVKMECLNGDTSFVFDSNSVAYRNVHCAQCSQVDKLWCFAKRKRKSGNKKVSYGISGFLPPAPQYSR